MFIPRNVHAFLLSDCKFVGGEVGHGKVQAVEPNQYIVALSLDFVVAIVTFRATQMSNSFTHRLLWPWS